VNTAAVAVIVTGFVIAALTLAGTVITRWVVREDYKVIFTGPSLKVEKRALPVARPPAPRVVILPGNGVADPLDRDFVVTEARS